MAVATKRRTTRAKAEPPIAGVAAGSLGTAANLDDTQVLRTEDLKAAAASPGWLDDDAQPAGPAGDLIPPDELALLQTGAVSTTAPGSPDRAATPRPAAAARKRRNAPALAGIAALVVLLLIAGFGILSQLDLGIATGAGYSTGTPTHEPRTSAPAPKPEAGKGGGGGHASKGCHGHGHGGGCRGGED
jgi:hypothetical protein